MPCQTRFHATALQCCPHPQRWPHLRPGFLQRGVLLPQPLALQLTAAQRLLATPQLVLQAFCRRLQPGDHSVRSGQLLASGMQGALQSGAVGCIKGRHKVRRGE